MTRTLLILLALLVSACASTPENTAGTGCIEYRGTAAPGIMGAAYVEGSLAVHGCRCNATSEPLIELLSHWCNGEGEP